MAAAERDCCAPLQVPVFLEAYWRALRFLRDSFKGVSASYEEVPLVEAFQSVVASQLTNHTVAFEEADVAGANGACYQHKYHYAHIRGDPDGKGSFRCLTTMAKAATWTDVALE
jgi:hypothetical protein